MPRGTQGGSKWHPRGLQWALRDPCVWWRSGMGPGPWRLPAGSRLLGCRGGEPPSQTIMFYVRELWMRNAAAERRVRAIFVYEFKWISLGFRRFQAQDPNQRGLRDQTSVGPGPKTVRAWGPNQCRSRDQTSAGPGTGTSAGPRTGTSEGPGPKTIWSQGPDPHVTQYVFV